MIHGFRAVVVVIGRGTSTATPSAVTFATHALRRFGQ